MIKDTKPGTIMTRPQVFWRGVISGVLLLGIAGVCAAYFLIGFAYRYPPAFGGVALIGLVCVTVGVYGIIHKAMTSWVDVCLMFSGGVFLISGISGGLGIIIVWPSGSLVWL
jgi:hypothetical protein